VLASIFSVACRRGPATPLREDPVAAARLTQQGPDPRFLDAVQRMTAEQAADLDAAVTKNPEDVQLTRQLLAFYRLSGPRVLGAEKTIAAQRPHLLWLIAHHPESDLLPGVMVLAPQIDPAGYKQARALWLAHTAAPHVSNAVLSNAARFFQGADAPIAEQLLLRLESIDPAGPTPRIQGNTYQQPWVERLGLLYAQTITAYVQNPYAAGIRKKLDDSNDAILLTAAGSALIRNARPTKAGFDPIELGRFYLERAYRLDPSSGARELLKSSSATERALRIREVVRAKQIELAGLTTKVNARERLSRDEQNLITSFQHQAESSLSDADRFAYLLSVVDGSYLGAEGRERNHLPDAGDWDRSQKFAVDLLALAPEFKTDAHYGEAIFEANVVLGLHAMRAGDVKGAVRFLHDAPQGPVFSEDSQYSVSLAPRLVSALLKAGERTSVAVFLERTARINPARKSQLLRDASAIRAGIMPGAYRPRPN